MALPEVVTSVGPGTYGQVFGTNRSKPLEREQEQVL